MIPIVCVCIVVPTCYKFWAKSLEKSSKCSCFKLCRGRQYTAATVISYRSPFTFMDVACIASSACFSCSYYVIVFFIIIAVSPWAVPSGWFLQQRSYPGMEK